MTMKKYVTFALLLSLTTIQADIFDDIGDGLSDAVNDVFGIKSHKTSPQEVYNALILQQQLRNNLPIGGNDPVNWTTLKNTILSSKSSFPKIQAGISPAIFTYQDKTGKTLLDYAANAPTFSNEWTMLLTDIKQNQNASFDWINFKTYFLTTKDTPALPATINTFILYKDCYGKTLLDYASNAKNNVSQWQNLLKAAGVNFYNAMQTNTIVALNALTNLMPGKYPLIPKPTDQSCKYTTTGIIGFINLPFTGIGDATSLQIILNMTGQPPTFFFTLRDVNGKTMGYASSNDVVSPITFTSMDKNNMITIAQVQLTGVETVINKPVATINNKMTAKAIPDDGTVANTFKEYMLTTQDQPNLPANITLSVVNHRDSNGKSLLDYAPNDQWLLHLSAPQMQLDFNAGMSSTAMVMQAILNSFGKKAGYALSPSGVSCIYEQNGTIRFLKIPTSTLPYGISFIQIMSAANGIGDGFYIIALDGRNQPIGYGSTSDITQPIKLSMPLRSTNITILGIEREINQNIMGVKNPLIIGVAPKQTTSIATPSTLAEMGGGPNIAKDFQSTPTKEMTTTPG